jgi:hypothetical protein
MSFLTGANVIALAYLDPGSGSFIIQMLLAGGLGLAFLIKTYWRKLIGFFQKNTGESQQVSPTEQDQNQNQ